MSTIRTRVTLEKNLAKVKLLIQHPMETGLVKDKKTGAMIPAHFIQDVRCFHNGKLVLQSDLGIAISKNPYLSFEFDGANSGDTLAVEWQDNMGKHDSQTITIDN